MEIFAPPPCCGITVSHAVQFRKLECWRSHYQNTLNHPPASQCPDLDSDAARAVPDLTVPDDAPTLGEVRHAIRKLKNGRAAGSDGIQPELLKYAEEPVSISLHSQFARVWKTGLVPAEWRKGIIVSLYKGKGERNNCGSYARSPCYPFQEKCLSMFYSRDSSHC